VEYSSHPILDGGQVRGAVITFVDITERKRAADALKEVNGAKDELELRVAERTRELSAALGQLRELAAYSEGVREEERTRIAREVHDELGSLLVALKMDVNWLDKRLGEQQSREPEAAQDMRDRMRSKCQNMSRLIENAVDNVGRIITDLRPSILDHQGLWAALEWQAQEFVQSAELALDWRMNVDGAPGAARAGRHGGVPHLPGDAVQRGPPCPGTACGRAHSGHDGAAVHHRV
jgi:signal transduction histidine kinase